MRAREVYRQKAASLDRPSRAHLSETVREGAVPKRLGPHGRLGIWVWIVLIGADAAFEMLSFLDGPGGWPTLSQLVKSLRRSGGVAGTVILALLLAAGYVVLNLHWVAEAF